MTAQQLKNSILQMAVQGKLVPQDQKDEPASVLLERIKAEKQALIKAGKIKKDKKSSEIFRGASHNLPYAYCEQIGKETRDISDEIPFDIPDSWEWIRFSNLVSFSMGKTPPRKESEYWDDAIYPWVSIADMPSDGMVLSTKEKVNQYAADNIFKSGISPIGTLIMSFKLTVGKVAILGIEAYHNEAIISIFPFADDNKVIQSYLFKILPLIAQNGNTKTAIKGATLNSDSLSNLLIPLPPIPEQVRIVKKIIELEPCVKSYDKAETQLTTLNTTFPEALKKSILQEAVQGKLVSQNPDDEPASVLLERIKAEKQKLIKEGKIKKEKPLAPITEEEIPFEIPESWEWVHLQEICSLIADVDHNMPKAVPESEGKLFLSAKDLLDDGTINYTENVKYISQEDFDRLSKKAKPTLNDIIYSRIGAALGKARVVYSDREFIVSYSCCVIRTLIDEEYLRYYLESPFILRHSVLARQSIGVPDLGMGEIKQYLVALPPLKEQKRIVAKIEELMPFINAITK